MFSFIYLSDLCPPIFVLIVNGLATALGGIQTNWSQQTKKFVGGWWKSNAEHQIRSCMLLPLRHAASCKYCLCKVMLNDKSGLFEIAIKNYYLIYIPLNWFFQEGSYHSLVVQYCSAVKISNSQGQVPKLKNTYV